jgi:hypothetical protein
MEMNLFNCKNLSALTSLKVFFKIKWWNFLNFKKTFLMQTKQLTIQNGLILKLIVLLWTATEFIKAFVITWKTDRKKGEDKKLKHFGIVLCTGIEIVLLLSKLKITALLFEKSFFSSYKLIKKGEFELVLKIRWRKLLNVQFIYFRLQRSSLVIWIGAFIWKIKEMAILILKHFFHWSQLNYIFV